MKMISKSKQLRLWMFLLLVGLLVQPQTTQAVTIHTHPPLCWDCLAAPNNPMWLLSLLESNNNNNKKYVAKQNLISCETSTRTKVWMRLGSVIVYHLQTRNKYIRGTHNPCNPGTWTTFCGVCLALFKNLYYNLVKNPNKCQTRFGKHRPWKSHTSRI